MTDISEDTREAGAAMVAAYLDHKVAEARAEVAQAQAKLAEAERRAHAFTDHGEIETRPRLVQSTGLQIVTWAANHTFKTQRDGTPAEGLRAKADYAAVVQWLLAHGFELTDAHRRQVGWPDTADS